VIMMIFQEPVGNGTVAGKIHSSSNSSSSSSTGGSVSDATITNRSRSRENLCNPNGNGSSLTVLPAGQPLPEPDQHTREQHGRVQ
jgi:hypothetical protein